MLTWSVLGVCASVPLILLSFFDLTARSLGAVRFSSVTGAFAQTLALTLPQWFQLVLLVAWAALVVVEVGVICLLACQHAHVLRLYRRAIAEDPDDDDEAAAAAAAEVASGSAEEAAVTAAEAAALRKQRAHEEAEAALVRAGMRRGLGCGAAVLWVVRGGVGVAAQVFNALGVDAAPAANALLIRTVVACIGAVLLVQLA